MNIPDPIKAIARQDPLPILLLVSNIKGTLRAKATLIHSSLSIPILEYLEIY
jgi:predicted DNA-binding ribbon-helix-helix protein